MKKIKNKDLSEKFKSFSFIFSCIVVLVGVAVLIGWIVNIPAFKNVSQNWVSMKANTAICFILSGTGLILLTRKNASLAALVVARVISVLIIFIAGLTLLQYLLNFNAGIDELLFKDDVGAIDTSHGGRIAPLTAICFILFSLSLLFQCNKKHGQLIAQVLNLAIGILAFISLVGYLFGAKQLLNFPAVTVIAFHSAFCLFLLMLAGWFSCPEEGIMKLISSDTIGGKLFRNVFPVMILVILLIGWLRLQGELAGFYNNRLGVTFLVISICLVFGIVLYANAASLSRSEKNLQQYKMHLKATYESSPNGLLLIDSNHTVIEFNTPFLNFSRIVWGRSLGKNENLLKIIPAQKRDNFIMNFIHVLGGETVNYEFSYPEFYDNNITFNVNLNPVRDNHEKVIGCFIICEDITERKNIEENRIELNMGLGREVMEKTEQYASANSELETFTHSVSHDLRAPLNAAKRYAQMLGEEYMEKVDEDGKIMLKNIVYNTQKMEILIDELLAFSKIGRGEVSKMDVDMNDLAEKVLIEIYKSAPHNATVKLSNLPVVEADYNLMFQAMQHLLSNAIKYSSKKDHPVVEVYLQKTDGKEIFVVKDNGAGFDMPSGDKLFGIFQRLHSEEEFEGLGVGLSIVDRIIAKHGGTIWAESKVNEGATFYFTLN